MWKGLNPFIRKKGCGSTAEDWHHTLDSKSLRDFLQVHIHSVSISKGGVSTGLRSGFLVGKVTHPGRTGSIICEIQSKTEMWSPLYKKQEKRKKKLFPFFPSVSLSLTTCSWCLKFPS